MEDELVKIWQSSPNQERVKFERSRLLLDVQTNIDRLNKMIKQRDLREIAGVALATPIFSFIAYRTPFVMTKIGALVIVLAGIFVAWRLRNAQKRKSDPVTATYLEYLYKTRQILRAQKHLLDTVLYWYISPFLIGVTFMLLGRYGEAEKLHMFIKGEIGAVLIGVIVYFLNKRAVKSILIPQLEKIERLISVLEKE